MKNIDQNLNDKLDLKYLKVLESLETDTVLP